MIYLFSPQLLLHFALLDSLFIQVFDELLPLHPVDERADVTVVAKKGSTGEVQRSSCEDRGKDTLIYNRHPVELMFLFLQND